MVKEKLLDVLESFGVPVYLQGTLAEDKPYPDEFITFFTLYADDGAHYDDETTSYVWRFSVMYYANDAEKVNTKPDEIRAALKAAGFIPQGKAHDILSDEPTHTGAAMEFLIVETEQ